MRITRIGPSFPVLTSATLGGGGGTISPTVGSGLVPVSNGSNAWAWSSNVQTISAGGSNVTGPFVNFAAGSNVTLTIDQVGAIASNTIRIHATSGAASFGSNSNAVSLANAPGASTDSSRADHVHMGVTSLAHSSNTFSGPVILTASGSLGITSPTPGTYNLSAGSGGGGGSGSVATDAIWDVKGDLAGGTGADAAVRLAVGSNGQVLTADSTQTTGLKWAAAGGGGGGLVLLQQLTASASASLDFTSFISSTYDDYVIRFVNVLPATTNVLLYLRMSTDGGATYDAGAAVYTNSAFRFHSGPGNLASGGTASFITCSGADGISNSATWGGLMGEMTLTNPGGAGYKRCGGFVGHGDGSSAVLENAILGGLYLSTTAVNAVRFLMSAGNITSGTIRIYGLTK